MNFGYKLVCLYNKFSKFFKTYLGKDSGYNFINDIIEEGKYSRYVKKRYFNQELVMAKENNNDFMNSIKCCNCDNDYVDADVKVRDYCHITGKYRGSAHKDYNINLQLNHKIPIVFQQLENYDSHLIIQTLGKFNFEISVITNGLEELMSFTINNRLSFIDRFQFLNSSLDGLVKSLNKSGFK